MTIIDANPDGVHALPRCTRGRDGARQVRSSASRPLFAPGYLIEIEAVTRIPAA
jgi:hypothetical protein